MTVLRLGCDYWIEEPTWLNLLEAFLPSSVTATMQTTALRATRSAYSTRLAPRSLLAAKRARMYGAMVHCQYEMRSTDCSLGSCRPLGGLFIYRRCRRGTG